MSSEKDNPSKQTQKVVEEKESIQKLHNDALSELSSLGRVSHRLAMTESGAPLEKVLTLLLPRLLTRIGSNHRRTGELVSRCSSSSDGGGGKKLSPETLEGMTKGAYDKIHAKLVEMLSHIMKRVRDDTACKVPCLAVLGLLYDVSDRIARDPTTVDPFTLNLSLAFLTLGLPRCDTDEIESILPGLLALVGAHSGVRSLSSAARKGQRNQVGHLLLRAIEAIISGNRSSSSSGTFGSSARKTGSSSLSNAPPSSSLAGKKVEITPGGESKIRDERMAVARSVVCGSDNTVASAAVYDLLLDVLLYQPEGGSSSLPPPGLSQCANERLRSGTSTTAKSWVAEFAPQVRLKELKLAILDFVAPCRRWALFVGDTVLTKHEQEETKEEDEDENKNSLESKRKEMEDDGMGTARTVALLVAASGDTHPDVSEQASSYLRAHMDSRRNVTSTTTVPSGDSRDDASNPNNGIGQKQENDTAASSTSTPTHGLLGQPISLTCALLSLVLGDAVATGIVRNFPAATAPLTLGSQIPLIDESTPVNTRSVVMSMKRRMVGDKVTAAILNFVACKVLDDIPRIFVLSGSAGLSKDTNGPTPLELAKRVGLLALAVVSNLLGSGGSGSSVGMASSRGNPRVEAARLLNSLCVRLAAFYDAMVSEEENEEEESAAATQLHGLLAKALAVSCSVLTASSSPHVAGSSSQGSLDTRDFCYGVVCTLARSKFAESPSGTIFNCGGSSLSSASQSSSQIASIATAALVFGCAANDQETLRPRAVAALDALLAAYCRVYAKEKMDMKLNETNDDVEMDLSTASNPWAEITSPKKEDATVKKNRSNFESLARSLLPLLWSAAQSSQPKASRLAAARWSSELVKPIDCANACHILCFLTGDADVTAAAIAKEGLGISEALKDDNIIGPPTSNESILPDFHELVTVLFESKDKATKTGKSTSSWVPIYDDFSPRGQGATLRFGLMCLLGDLYGGGNDAVKAYISAIFNTIIPFSSQKGATHGRESVDLLDECSICLAGCLATSRFARRRMVWSSDHFTLNDIASLAISANSSRARRHLATAMGHLYEDKTIWCKDDDETLISLEKWVEACKIAETMETCASKLDDMQNNLHMSGEIHGAAFLGSRCMRAFRLAAIDDANTDLPNEALINKCWNSASRIITAMGLGTLHSDEVIGDACSQGMSVAFSYDTVDAPILDRRLYGCSAQALSKLNDALRKYGNGDHTDPMRASSLARAAGMTLAASTSGAGATMDNSAAEEIVALGPARIQCVEALFALLGSSAFRKDNEISLVVGEALVKYADAYSPEGAVWTRPSTGEQMWPEKYDDEFAAELPPHEHVLYKLLRKEIKASNPHKRTSCAPAILALVGHCSRLVNNNQSYMNRAFVTELLKHLPETQDSFVSLLADPKSKQLSRESCCLGLAACRGLSVAASSADEANPNISGGANRSYHLNERLLRAFGQTTNFGGSAMQETREQEAARRRQENRDSNSGVGAAASMMEDFGMDTEVGGTSGMGEAALGAYREMAGAAMSLDRPDVLYSLLLLSVTHLVWFSSEFRDRYNATSLLGRESALSGVNTLEIKEALRPHLAILIPRLLRACNDPNKQTREQMNALWTGLTGGGAEARAVITQHLLSTIDVLIQDATSKLWRARVGACGALADVIVGRNWKELGGGEAILDDDDIVVNKGKSSSAGARLLQLWRVTTRSLDDVRLTVRESGEGLARSLRSLTIRLCDPSTTDESGRDIYRSSASRLFMERESEANAALAASTALRWLVKHGLNQPCAEATGCCVSCLLGIVDVARPSTLQPVLSGLIGSLTMAMSGLEPSALNYLQVRAAGNDSNRSGAEGSYDRLERLRLQMAQTGPIAGALTKCLDMMRFMSLEAQKEVIPHIDSALRAGAGFATRAAAADAVSTLCHTCPLAFKFAGSSSTNPTVRLLRALYFASERERGSAARDKMTHALGSLAELAPGNSVRALALRACEKYCASMGSNDDPAARKAAAAALRSIAVRASSQFSEGGSGDIWCRRVLPMAFLGQKDEDSKVASLWKDVWEEGGTAANISGNDSKSFGVLLHERLLPHLVRECNEALNDVSWSRRVAACASLIDLTNMNVLAPAPRPLESNVKNLEKSKDLLLRSRRRAQASSSLLTTCVKLIVKSRVWTGKAELVKASVNIASKWATIGYLDDSSNWVLLGWERKEEEKECACSWVPVTSKVGDWDDLISGDNWFAAKDKKNREMEMNDATKIELNSVTRISQTGEEGDETDDSKLNFDEEDRILEEEGEPETSKSVSINEPESVSEGVVTFSGLCRALLEQATPNSKSSSISSIDEILPYRAASLQGLSDLLCSLTVHPTEETNSTNDHRLMFQQYMYSKLAPLLVNLIVSDELDSSAVSQYNKQPPLIVARSIDCLASAIWDGIGEIHEETGIVNDHENIARLSKLFCISCGGKQPAWTVREASALAGASLASKASLVPLRKHETLSTLLDCTVQTSKDRKFWRVRHAGLKLLHALVSRVGSQNQHPSVVAVSSNKGTNSAHTDQQLMLEALLPHKEMILKLARASLSDSEAKVTAVATDVCGTVAWWP